MQNVIKPIVRLNHHSNIIQWFIVHYYGNYPGMSSAAATRGNIGWCLRRSCTLETCSYFTNLPYKGEVRPCTHIYEVLTAILTQVDTLRFSVGHTRTWGNPPIPHAIHSREEKALEMKLPDYVFTHLVE